MKKYYVYILASRKHGTLYVGVTSNLMRRTHEYRKGDIAGFTKKYGVTTLVHMEYTTDVHSALYREKQLKWWKREYKIELIEKENPHWDDLSGEIY